MRKLHPSLSTRTLEFTPRELPLAPPTEVPPQPPPRAQERAAADRIKDALLRWLDEEM
jgi:hypothetical protein